MRLFLMTLGVVAASGCTSKEQVWIVQYGVTETSDETFNCTENLTDAGCPESASPVEDGWTDGSSDEVSPGVGYAYIHDAADGGMVLVASGNTFYGEKDSGTWKFTWVNSEHNIVDRSHDDGYSWVEETDSVVTTTYAIDFSGDSFTGSLDVLVQSRNLQTESDQWDPDETQFFQGQLDTSLLTQNAPNFADVSDCSDTHCEIDVKGSYTQSTPLDGQRTTDQQTAWDGLRFSGQNPGTDN